MAQDIRMTTRDRLVANGYSPEDADRIVNTLGGRELSIVNMIDEMPDMANEVAKAALEKSRKKVGFLSRFF